MVVEETCDTDQNSSSQAQSTSCTPLIMATPVHRNAPMDHSNSKNPEPTDYIKRTLLRLIQIGRIYGHAPHAQWIISTKKHSCCHYRQKKDKYASLYCPADADVGLIRTCQQIYHEPRGMLFEINTFTLHSILLPNLQTATRLWPIWKTIRKLKIDACCKNLQSATQVSANNIGSPRHLFPRASPDCHWVESKVRYLGASKLEGGRVYRAARSHVLDVATRCYRSST